MYLFLTKPNYFIDQPSKDKLVVTHNIALAKLEFAFYVVLVSTLWLPLFFIHQNIVVTTLIVVWPIGCVLISYRYITRFLRLLKHGGNSAKGLLLCNSKMETKKKLNGEMA